MSLTARNTSFSWMKNADSYKQSINEGLEQSSVEFQNAWDDFGKKMSNLFAKLKIHF